MAAKKTTTKVTQTAKPIEKPAAKPAPKPAEKPAAKPGAKPAPKKVKQKLTKPNFPGQTSRQAEIQARAENQAVNIEKEQGEQVQEQIQSLNASNPYEGISAPGASMGQPGGQIAAPQAGGIPQNQAAGTGNAGFEGGGAGRGFMGQRNLGGQIPGMEGLGAWGGNAGGQPMGRSPAGLFGGGGQGRGMMSQPQGGGGGLWAGPQGRGMMGNPQAVSPNDQNGLPQVQANQFGGDLQRTQNEAGLPQLSNMPNVDQGLYDTGALGRGTNEIFQNAMENIQPQMKQQQDDFEQMAANRGWTPGSKVYDQQKKALMDQQSLQMRNIQQDALKQTSDYASTKANIGSQGVRTNLDVANTGFGQQAQRQQLGETSRQNTFAQGSTMFGQGMDQANSTFNQANSRFGAGETARVNTGNLQNQQFGQQMQGAQFNSSEAQRQFQNQNTNWQNQWQQAQNQLGWNQGQRTMPAQDWQTLQSMVNPFVAQGMGTSADLAKLNTQGQWGAKNASINAAGNVNAAGKSAWANVEGSRIAQQGAMDRLQYEQMYGR